MAWSISPCVCWPSVCLLWRNVYLGLLSIFFVFWPCCVIHGIEPAPLQWKLRVLTTGQPQKSLFCAFFDCFVCCFGIKLYELFVYFGTLSLAHHIVCKYLTIFSQSTSYLFVLFMISFAVQKLLSLIRSYLFIYFYFHYCRRQIPSPQENIAVNYIKKCSAYGFL